jgi:DNA primase
MSSLDEIKSRIDIVELISESVQLRRTGKNYTGFCPFHSNTRTPAFVVFPDTGTWRCFGQCNDGGDIFGFMMKKEGWDFSEALRRLAERAGIELRPPTPAEQAAAEEHEGLRAILEAAATYFHHNLMSTTEGKAALEYLHQKRNLSDQTLEAFGLGFALHSWDALTTHFISKGYKKDDLVACGLVSERDQDRGEGGERFFDRFRNRIMFPIRDERGRMAGFGARCFDPEDLPKFLNSPQTPIFDKGSLLYGLDRARKSIRSMDRAFLVEGYLDVIALHQAGYTNSVSPMGTALTEAQLRLLKRFSRRIVMALDADAAGEKATLRGLQIARQTMDRETDLVFDARGLLGYEARLKADIRVTTLPEGMDPDDVVNQDPQEWERVIENAKPIVEHVMETLAASHDINDPKVKSEIAAQVLPLIEDVANPIERETYRQRLARVLRVDERALVGVRATKPSRLRRRFDVSGYDMPANQPPPQVLTQVTVNEPLEVHCLGILLRQPELLYRVDRTLQEYQLGRLSTADFRSSDKQMILELIEASLRQDHTEPVNYVLNSLSLPLMDLADRLLMGSEKLDPNEERVLEDLIRTVLELRKRNLHQNIDHLRFLMEEAQQGGEDWLAEYLQTMNQYSETRIRIDKALGKVTGHVM